MRQRDAELTQRVAAWEQLRAKAELQARNALDRYQRALEVVLAAREDSRQSLPEELAKLEEQLKAGEIDFVLKCVAPSLSRFQAFVTELTGAPNVLNVKTSLTLRNAKNDPLVPDEMLRTPPHGV